LTCYIFATKLVLGLKQLEDCKPLLEAEHADKLAALKDLLAT
jgi:ArsR family metal-binding transcriptional regulator